MFSAMQHGVEWEPDTRGHCAEAQPGSVRLRTNCGTQGRRQPPPGRTRFGLSHLPLVQRRIDNLLEG